MDEFEKWLVELNELNKQEHRVVPKQYPDWTCAKYNTSSDILSKYRAFKAKADGGLVRLCKELIQTIHQCKDWDGEGDPLDSVDLDKAKEILRAHEGGAK